MMLPTALPIVAAAYGLSEEEVTRALRWARIAKSAACKGTSVARPTFGAAIPPATTRFCEQCDRRVSAATARSCGSRFCKAKDLAQ